MIRKFKKIEKFSVFKDYSWPDSLPLFNKYNLIYGWNGSGKTSISTILMQLEKKKYFDKCGKFHIDTDNGVIDENNVNFNNLSIKVFNRDFISKNVFSESNPLTPIYYLGEDTIVKKKELDLKKKDNEDISKKTDDIESKIKQLKDENEKIAKEKAHFIKDTLRSHHPNNKYNNYDKSDYHNCINSFDEDYKNLVLNEKIITELLEKCRIPAKEIASHINNFGLDFENFGIKVIEIVNRQISSTIIERLAKDTILNKWVEEGYRIVIHKSSTFCPFCENKISRELVEQLESHYSQEYRRFCDDSRNICKQLDDSKNSLKINFPNESQFYEEYKSDYLNLKTEIESEINYIFNYLSFLEENLNKKIKNPFENNQSSIEVQSFKANLLIKILNALISNNNSITTNYMNEMEKARIKLECSYCAESFPTFSENLERITNCNSEKDELIKEKNEIISQITKLEKEIIEHQKPAEEINNELYHYFGHNEISFRIQSDGYQIIRDGETAFDLCEGEKSAIALVYFLKSLNDRSFDKSNGIVVIDDPVSSLDSNLLFNAFGFIKSRTSNINQVFLLTHNYPFLKLAIHWLNTKNKRSNDPSKRKNEANFYILKIKHSNGCRTSYLDEMDDLILKYKSEYHYLFSLLYNISNSDSVDLKDYYIVPNIARRFFEGFLAFKATSVSGLGEQIYKVKVNGKCWINNNSERYMRIERFINTNSHHDHIAGDGDDDFRVLSETPHMVKELFSIIQEIDPDHYSEMESLVQ